ncbi:MAG: 3-methyl-2-oxobutanoate hydroxymethyltransferase [Micavibrio aeruginosavorus]|uniref:3-methyl-2-oxobutanoate hydroxymethyltransferase n=1 Tax=Micavibrio aeruginosavorus TaxID=349221 RepID=A0A2W5PJ93_9BACT|nr:MAG: 3-methyl-2-oxobutanoate hydroxymethyltransferase [Micavibrio aeruginosavorus]
MRKTIPDIMARKGAGSAPLVCLTAYTAPVAELLDLYCDVLLVGDSVAMVLYGEPSTLQADMDMMIRHGRSVQRASKNALVVVDMPFGSYQDSKESACRNATRILSETGASSVKLEGGAEMAETIHYLVERGVPVMGHIGLQPQSVNSLGGYKAQGRDEISAQKIIEDAKAVAKAGAYAIVLEGVAEKIAGDVVNAVTCPVIGIGASAACDGQILVVDDMLGLTSGKKAKFVKEYASLSVSIEQAVKSYAADVRSRVFPSSAHVYGLQDSKAPIMPTNAPGTLDITAVSAPKSSTEEPLAPAPMIKDDVTPTMQGTAKTARPAMPSLQARPASPAQENKPINVFEGVLRATKRPTDY